MKQGGLEPDSESLGDPTSFEESQSLGSPAGFVATFGGADIFPSARFVDHWLLDAVTPNWRTDLSISLLLLLLLLLFRRGLIVRDSDFLIKCSTFVFVSPAMITSWRQSCHLRWLAGNRLGLK